MAWLHMEFVLIFITGPGQAKENWAERLPSVCWHLPPWFGSNQGGKNQSPLIKKRTEIWIKNIVNKLDSLTPQDTLCLVDHGQMAPYTNSVHFHQPQTWLYLSLKTEKKLGFLYQLWNFQKQLIFHLSNLKYDKNWKSCSAYP